MLVVHSMTDEELVEAYKNEENLGKFNFHYKNIKLQEQIRNELIDRKLGLKETISNSS